MSKYNGYHPKRNRIYQTMTLYDKDERGNIDSKEFLRMVFERPYERDSEYLKESSERSMQTARDSSAGTTLLDLAAELKESLSQEEVQMMMRKSDPRRTGRISLSSFIDFNRNTYCDGSVMFDGII